MSLILSLDTSSTSCSAALHDSGKLLCVAEIHQEHSHGSRLALLLRQVMENSGCEFSDLSAIALASGPGSYTGLRIGVSTAKGLCFSSDIPLISVDSLSVMTQKARKIVAENHFLCPMLDARRMEVYCALQDGELNFVEPIQALVIDHNSFQNRLREEKIVFFGNGAAKVREILHHPNAIFLDHMYPSAVELGELALKKFEMKLFEDLVHFEPLYLKEFLIKKSSKMDSLLNK